MQGSDSPPDKHPSVFWTGLSWESPIRSLSATTAVFSIHSPPAAILSPRPTGPRSTSARSRHRIKHPRGARMKPHSSSTHTHSRLAQS